MKYEKRTNQLDIAHIRSVCVVWLPRSGVVTAVEKFSYDIAILVFWEWRQRPVMFNTKQSAYNFATAAWNVPLTVRLGPEVEDQKRFAEKKRTPTCWSFHLSLQWRRKAQRARRMNAKEKADISFVMLYVLNAKNSAHCKIENFEWPGMSVCFADSSPIGNHRCILHHCVLLVVTRRGWGHMPAHSFSHPRFIDRVQRMTNLSGVKNRKTHSLRAKSGYVTYKHLHELIHVLLLWFGVRTSYVYWA